MTDSTTGGADEQARYFRQQLLEWGKQHRREFPWRQTTDPYAILIAEMMLRRTQARQVAPVYRAFLSRFPGVQALAAAPPEEVEGMLRPLGLAWRVSAFQRLARQLAERYDGRVPCDRQALLSLPGVGNYVADAVRCLAFGKPVVLVDSNTVRVAGRYFGFPVSPESRRRKAVQQAVARLVDLSVPRESNLALLDFAALVCRARLPLHDRCPVAGRCAFWQMELAQHKLEEATTGADADRADQRDSTVPTESTAHTPAG
jgi:A/G-specific adenine glycosylase